MVGVLLNQDALKHLGERLKNLSFLYKTDITNHLEVKTFTHKTISPLGVPYLLLNNAGKIIMPHFMKFPAMNS